MTVGGGEAADQLVRMMLSGGEVAVRLSGSALKNLLALTMALAQNHKTLSGKVNMGKMLQETRDLRLFPMSPEQFKQFQKHAKKQKILFSAIKDRDVKGKVIDVVMPVTELDRANLIFERILYRGPAQQSERAPSRPERDHSERDRESPQQTREAPQMDRSGQEQREWENAQQPPHPQTPDNSEVIPPKKDSRSGRDLRDTRTSSVTSRETSVTSDRSSILGKLQEYRAQLDSGSRSAPAREKTRVKPKAR